MESLWQWGIALIVAVQSTGGERLDAVFRAVSFLGEEQFYLVLFPLLLWCCRWLCWALAIANAYPFLVDRVPANQAGTYTGLWNATIGLAGLISPPIYGLVVDTFGFGAFFIPGYRVHGRGSGVYPGHHRILTGTGR